MSKITICVLLIIIAVQQKATAQSIEHAVWKSFFGPPINDTAILTISTDSLTLTNAKGMLVVKSVVSINKDTIRMNDVGGRNKCAAADTGVYKFIISGETLILHIVDDPCDGRANAIGERKWTADKKK